MLEAMTTTKTPIGSSVQEWFDEEEARSPGFIAAMDEANLRDATAAALKRLRADSGLTQAELANRMGVKQPVIARIESGKVLPDFRTVHRFAHALGYLVGPPVFRRMPESQTRTTSQRKSPPTRDSIRSSKKKSV